MTFVAHTTTRRGRLALTSAITVALAISASLALAAPAPTDPAVRQEFAGSGPIDWSTPPRPTAEPVFRPPTPRRLQLANGLTVLVVENHALPIVAMTLVVPGAGSAADPPGKLGLASFVADLIDEGAGGLGALALAEQEERLGAAIEAYVEPDGAAVTARTLAKSLDATFELIAKQVAEPAFAPAEVERVRGDRKTSLEQRRDRPREMVNLVLAGALYGAASPYGHAANGYLDDLRATTVDDLRTFYRQRWHPANATLVIAGDVDASTLTARLGPSLGRWRAAATAPASPALPPPAAPGPSRLLIVDRPGAEQSDVRVGLVGPDRKDPRYYAFEVLRTALGDGFTSRLTQRLREDLGITYGVRAYMDWRVRRGPFAIATAIVTPQTGTGIRETLRIVGELAARDLPAAELQKSKQNLIRALPGELESNLATTGAIAELVLLGLPPTWYDSYAARVRKVTAAQVRAAAASLLSTRRMVVSLVGDLAVLRAELGTLGLGPLVQFDAHGHALPATAGARP